MTPQITLMCKTFPTLSAGIQLFSSVTYFVIIQMVLCCKPFVTHRTHIRPWLVTSSVTNTVVIQTSFPCKPFVTDRTHIRLWLVTSSVTDFVIIQTSFLHKPFVTHRTHIRPWLVIIWMLSDIITISFSLNFKGSFTCIIYTT